jgi:hypothetical protein
MANVGLYWKNKLRRQLTKVAYDVVTYGYEAAPTKCPGAWPEDTEEYDFEADAAYHLANPEAEVCRNGLIGTIVTTEVKGFYFDNLKESMIIELGIGNLDENEGVFIADGYVNLENIVTIEYPTGVFYQFIFKRDIRVGTEIIAQYGKVRKSNGVL